MKRFYAFLFVLLFILPVFASQTWVVGEVFTESWCSFCPAARSGLHQLADNDEEAPFFIPLIWQGDSEYQSPNYGGRGSLYGVSGIPHSQWQGYLDDVGGGDAYPRYLSHYQNIVQNDSPATIDIDLNVNGSNQLEITADVELTGDITTTNNKICYILTYDLTGVEEPDYFASVTNYEDEDFMLTNAGETGMYSAAFPLDSSWELPKVKAVVLIQTFAGDHYIHQAATTGFTGTLALFSANVTSGPAQLGVRFNDMSLPTGEIDSWEWDLDGDGEVDSTEENPYFLYETPGTYDVSLTITKDDETDTMLAEEMITVTEGDEISGNLSGIWVAEYSPYTIVEDVAIDQGAMLQIEPGVTINVENEAEFYIYGTLQANGSDEEKDEIVFTTASTWNGLRFLNNMNDNIINNCDISGSISAAIKANASKLEVLNSTLHHNNAISTGAAIHITDSDDVVLFNNIMANNNGSNLSGAISLNNASPLIINNVIVNNTSNMTGAISMKQGSDATLINNTIANNLANNSMIFLFNSMPVLKNNILRDSNNVFTLISSAPTISYSNISGGNEGMGNIDEDPMFEAPTEGDGDEYDGLNAQWNLLEGSPCIDAGDPAAEYYDLEDPQNPGQPLWPAMGTLTNDMGAYGGHNYQNYVPNQDPQVTPITANPIKVYPNPFNPSTNISFSLQNAAVATVNIYNLKGQLVKTLVHNQTLPAGDHTLAWHGNTDAGENAASGIYFVKLQTKSNTSTQKMLLLK